MTRKISSPPGQPRRLGDPRIGIAPDAGAVLGDREVEADVGQRHFLGVAVQERVLETVLGLQVPRRRQLPFAVVDPDRLGAAPRQPGGDVAGAAAELD